MKFLKSIQKVETQRFVCSALICNVPGMFLLITLCSFTGLALYANYVTCDPLKNGDVANENQVYHRDFKIYFN